MWLANAEQVHGYLIPLVAYIGKAVPVYVGERNMTYTTLEHVVVDKISNCGNRRKANRIAIYAKRFHKFEIKIICYL